MTKTVAILVLSGEEAGLPLSEVYGSASKAIERHTALNVAPLDVLGISAREAAIRECAGKPACFAAKVRTNATVKVELLLTVSVDRLDEGLLLGFRLVDIGTEAEIASAGDELPIGMSLFGAMEQQLSGVFPKSVWDQIAGAKIQSEPAAAEVSLGDRSCVTPCELKRMVPGTYEVTIKKAGFDKWTGNLTLTAGQQAALQAELVEPEGSLVTNPWLWTGVVAGVAALGVGAFFLFRPTDRTVNICIADQLALCEN